MKQFGSVSLSSSSSNVTVGDEITISVNLSGASIATLTVKVAVDTSKVEYVSGPSNSSFSNGRAIYTWTDPNGGSTPKTEGTIVSFKFRAKVSGKATFSVTGDFYNPDEEVVNPSFSGTSINIKEQTQTPPAEIPETPSTPQTPPSTNNTGSTVTPPTTGGQTSQKPATNNQSTSNQSTSNQSSVSSNANLKSLHLDVEGLSPAFNKSTTKYYIVVPSSINSINVTAEPENADAKVNITGNKDLKLESNKINIAVVAPDGKTTKNYVINVTKTDNPNASNANLENLAIENVEMTPEFNADVTEYKVEIPSIMDKLNILAIPQNEKANVKIEGNENIPFGDSQILITVISEDTLLSKQYIVYVHRKTETEEINENMRTLKMEPISNETRTITFGEYIFIVIITIGTGYAIYMLIKEWAKDNNVKLK